MRRVCAPGGRVVVIDSAPAPGKEHQALFRAAGLPDPRVTGYRLEGELEGLIARSSPDPGDDETLRRIFRASMARDGLDLGVREVDGHIRFGYPVAVLVAERG